MPQLSLYLDDAAMEGLRSAAQSQRQSLSQYARERICGAASLWPQSFWGTYGALKDESFTLPAELDASLDGALPSFD